MSRIITITGTESTGKTTLAEALSARLKLPLVADVSRQLYPLLEDDYDEDDLLQMAYDIVEDEDNALRETDGLIISDNCLINIKVWMEFEGFAAPSELNELIRDRISKLYLFCNIDLPWVADSQRKNQTTRAELFNRFRNELMLFNCPVAMIEGNDDERFRNALKHVQAIVG